MLAFVVFRAKCAPKEPFYVKDKKKAVLPPSTPELHQNSVTKLGCIYVEECALVCAAINSLLNLVGF